MENFIATAEPDIKLTGAEKTAILFRQHYISVQCKDPAEFLGIEDVDLLVAGFLIHNLPLYLD